MANLLSKDRDFYKSFFSLWYVLVLNNIIILSVNLADNIMLGAYSEAALSGAAACNQLQFIFQQIMVGLGNTAVVLGSRFWGQGRTDEIKKTATGAYLSCLFFSAIFFLLALTMPQQLVRLFTDSDVITEQGIEYLRIIKYTYPLFALTNVLLAVMRSAESVRIGFKVSLITLVLNISLNYLFIFGKLGIPQMGVKGAAIATLISRAAEFIVVLLHILLFEKNIKMSLKDFFVFDKKYVKNYLSACGAIVLTDGLFGVSTALQTVILGHMSDPAIAANSVASTLYQVLKVASVGSASAAAVIIGKTLGEGKNEKIREYARTMQIIFLCIGILTGILLFFIRIPILHFYNISAEAKELANAFLLVLCVTGVGTAYQMPVNTGIVRGGGDSKFVMKVDIISIWGIVLPLSFLAAFKFHLNPVIVIACLNSDQVFKCLPAFIKVNRYRWMKKVTD